MGVDFNSVDNFETALNALGTVMYEGFDPTPKKYYDYSTGITKV